MAIEFVALTIGGRYVQFIGSFDSDEPQRLWAGGTGVGPSSVFRRQEHPGGRPGSTAVSFQMPDGHYLEAVAGTDHVGATTTTVGPDQLFEETWLPDDRVALRTRAGRFVCAEGGGGREVVTNRSSVGAWEKFFYEAVPEGLLPDQFRRERPRLDDARSDRVEQVDLSPDTPAPDLRPTPSQRFDPTTPPRRLGR